jgi:FkbM family methyltransferase
MEMSDRIVIQNQKQQSLYYMLGYKFIRLRKLLFILFHPSCWKALRLGVAPSIEHHAVLINNSYDLVLDVGANRGQFAMFCRIIKPSIPIVAFEPIPNEAMIFRKVMKDMLDVQLQEVALGDKACEAELHLSHRPDSSSLLALGNTQTKLHPDTYEIGKIKVPVRRADEFKHCWENYSQILMKIDVQGFELAVLKGATETLTQCSFIYLECSETELYVGQALYAEITAFLNQNGFELKAQCHENWLDGKLVHADCLFARSSAAE